MKREDAEVGSGGVSLRALSIWVVLTYGKGNARTVPPNGTDSDGFLSFVLAILLGTHEESSGSFAEVGAQSSPRKGCHRYYS